MSAFDNKMLNGSNMMMEAVNAIRAKSDARRDIESRVLAENNLGSKNQLFAGSLEKFNHIVDTLVENKDADISLKIFDAQEAIAEVAKDARFTPRQLDEGFWDSRKKTSGPTKTPFTRQDAYPEKNSTFLGAPKETKNKGGFAGGAKAVSKGDVTMMKRNRLKEDGEDLQEVTYSPAAKDTKKTERRWDKQRAKRIKSGEPSKEPVDGKHLASISRLMGHGKDSKSYENKMGAYWKERKARGSYGPGAGADRTMDRRHATIQRQTKARYDSRGFNKNKNEDLQELSKDTLHSYRKKAHMDIGQRVLKAHDQAQTDWKSASKEKTKVAKRAVGINRASAKMKKEDMDLQELSRKTLGSYVKKAAPEIDAHSAHQVSNLAAWSKSKETQRDLKNKRGAKDKLTMANAQKDEVYHGDKEKRHMRKLKNRLTGVGRAADRLTKEETDLQELSRDTVKSYHSKARKDVGQRVIKGHDLAQTDWKSASKEKSKVARRLVGLNRANDRLDKREDLEAYAEEIIETILEMEGLRIEQLTESGLAKLEALVEQVMMDEGTPTPNPKGAPRGERDPGDYKNPSGHSNKSVDKATLADRKLVKKNGGRFPDQNSY